MNLHSIAQWIREGDVFNLHMTLNLVGLDFFRGAATDFGLLKNNTLGVSTPSLTLSITA